MKTFPLLALILTLSLSGCALLRGGSGSASGGEAAVETGTAGRYETAVIFATGDMRGALLQVRPGHGGSALLKGYFREARREFGDRAVWLDAGRLRGRSLDYGFDRGASFEDFLQNSGMAVTLGEPEASLPSEDRSTGQVLLTEAREPVPSRNASSSAPSQLDRQHPAMTLIDAGRLKIGAISAGSAEELLSEAKAARAEGAELVVWLSDLPIRCNPNPVVEHAPMLRKPGSPNGFCEGAINDIVSSLPEGTVNAVIATGDGRPLERFIYPRYSSNPVAGVPVVAASPFGMTFHLIYLAYDPRAGQPVLSRTRIEGPIPVEEGKLHGHAVGPDRETEKRIRPVQAWISEQEKNVLAKSSVVLSGDSQRESGLGDLVADALKAETRSDFAIVEPGLTKNALERSALPAGAISSVDLERALPEDASVLVIPVSGEELKTLVRISENGSRGFSAVSGMKLRLIRPDRDAPAKDLDGNRHLSLWERNRLLELTDPDDEPIHAHQTYRLAVPGYLVHGGDDWQWASRHFGLTERVSRQNASDRYPSARELVARYLKQLGKIDDIPQRIRFENPPGRGRHRARRHPFRHHRRRISRHRSET